MDSKRTEMLRSILRAVEVAYREGFEDGIADGKLQDCECDFGMDECWNKSDAKKEFEEAINDEQA